MLTKRRLVFVASIALFAFVFPAATLALETDQFTVPPKPLSDTAPELNGALFQILQQITARANYDITQHEARAAAASGKKRDRELAAMKQLLGETYIAKELSNVVSHGVPECKIEQWIRRASLGPDTRFGVSA